MNIVLGAGGQVGSEVARILESNGNVVRRVLHHNKPATPQGNNSEVVNADYFDKASLTKAFAGGDTVLLLTPESMTSTDMLADAQKAFHNYQAALADSGIRRIVALSSGGAQLSANAGTLRLYAMLEEAMVDVGIETFIVRPAYAHPLGG